MKHTAAPWSVFARPATQTLEVQAKDKPIVHWTGFDQADQQWREKVANATLMAASPDLKAALASALDLFGVEVESPDDREPRTIGEAWYRQAREAIAKAEGREA